MKSESILRDVPSMGHVTNRLGRLTRFCHQLVNVDRERIYTHTRRSSIRVRGRGGRRIQGGFSVLGPTRLILRAVSLLIILNAPLSLAEKSTNCFEAICWASFEKPKEGETQKMSKSDTILVFGMVCVIFRLPPPTHAVVHLPESVWVSCMQTLNALIYTAYALNRCLH